MAELRLRVEDFQDAEHWRWLLQDQAGAFLADHQVTLDPDEPEYEGFCGLGRVPARPSNPRPAP
jgi:hypothetical protein